jgi:predicted transcriptional regulator
MKIMIGFRVAKDFKKFLQEMADSENRTLSSFLQNAVLYYIKKEKGIDYKKESSPKPPK